MGGKITYYIIGFNAEYEYCRNNQFKDFMLNNYMNTIEDAK